MNIDEIRAYYARVDERELALHAVYYLVNLGEHMSALSDTVAALTNAVNQAIANGDAFTVQGELDAVNADVTAAVAALNDAASRLSAAFPAH